jgi:hypothetical protein
MQSPTSACVLPSNLCSHLGMRAAFEPLFTHHWHRAKQIVLEADARAKAIELAAEAQKAALSQ